MVSKSLSASSPSSCASSSSSSVHSLYEISSSEEQNDSVSLSSGEDNSALGSSEEEADFESNDGDAGFSANDEDDRCGRVVRLLQEGNDLSLLTLEDCKAYLRKHKLRLTGTKGICINRICEHWRLKDGDGLKMHPKSSFIIDCTGDVCTGDVVLFTQRIFDKFDVMTRGGGRAIGKRTVAGRILKESYGARKQQHTFTVEILWSTGVKTLPPLFPLLVKGRNLYRLKTLRQRWHDESKRKEILAEKHKRGAVARHLRAISKAQRGNEVLGTFIGSKRKSSATERPPRKRHRSCSHGVSEKLARDKANILDSAHRASDHSNGNLTTANHCVRSNSSNYYQNMRNEHGPYQPITEFHYPNFGGSSSSSGIYSLQSQYYGSSSLPMPSNNNRAPSNTGGYTVFPSAVERVQWDPTIRDTQIAFQRKIHQEIPAHYSFLQMPSNGGIPGNLVRATSLYASEILQPTPTGRELQRTTHQERSLRWLGAAGGGESQPLHCSTPGCQNLGSRSCVVLAYNRCCRAMRRECRRHH